MKNLNCNQINIFISLKIIREGDKNKNNIYLFIYLKSVSIYRERDIYIYI